jgi:cob(I)alamin adenosyltransferase
MARVYTRTGDTGETGLIGGSRVLKSDLRVGLYGTADELNALLGVVVAALSERDGDTATGAAADRLTASLKVFQSRLFDLGSLLADPERCETLARSGDAIAGLSPGDIEEDIDRLDADLLPMKHFVLPGGTSAAAALHVARTVCRRLERDLVGATEAIAIPGVALIWVNRLSDWLFVAARWSNHVSGVDDIPWTPSQ